MIWGIAALMLACVGVLCVAMGLFWDRPGWRGRPTRRCRKCGYDLCDAGEVPVTCTECGREHRTERSLRRVRRHKRMVAVGLLVLLGLPALVLAPMGTYYQRLPSWLLAELVTVHGTDTTKLETNPGGVLINRLIATMHPDHGGLNLKRAMTNEEAVAVIRRIAEGNFYAPAGSPRWIETSGAWIGGQSFRFQAPGGGWQYPDGTPADEELNQAFEKLSQILPPWDPNTRGIWPAGSKVKIHSGFKRPIWPVEGDLNERAVLRIDGHEDIVVDGFKKSFSIESIGEPGDRIEAELELSLFRDRVWNRTPDSQPVKTERFSIGWTVANSIDDVLNVADSEQVRKTMIASVVPAVARTLNNPGFEDVWLDQAFDRVAFGIEVEVFDGDESLGKSQHWWMAADGEWITRGTSVKGTSKAQYNAFGVLSNAARDKGALRVVIRGDPELVWSGEVDVLYNDAVKAAEEWAEERAQEETPPESTGP